MKNITVERLERMQDQRIERLELIAFATGRAIATLNDPSIYESMKIARSENNSDDAEAVSRYLPF